MSWKIYGRYSTMERSGNSHVLRVFSPSKFLLIIKQQQIFSSGTFHTRHDKMDFLSVTNLLSKIINTVIIKGCK